MNEVLQYFHPDSMHGPVKLHLSGTSCCDSSYRINRDPPTITVFEAVTSGHGFLTVDGHRLHPAAGDVYIAPGWKHHEYGSSGTDPWKKSWLNVSGSLVEHLLKAYRIENIYLFRGAEEASELICSAVETLFHLPEKELDSFISDRIFHIIRSLGNAYGCRETINTSAEKIRLFLRKYLMRPMPSLGEIAACIERSPAQTIRIFKDECGKTPYDYLLEEKIDAASELLIGSGKSIKEIAFMFGFHDEYYFSRLFKRKRGLSPRGFREKGKNTP